MHELSVSLYSGKKKSEHNRFSSLRSNPRFTHYATLNATAVTEPSCSAESADITGHPAIWLILAPWFADLDRSTKDFELKFALFTEALTSWATKMSSVNTSQPKLSTTERVNKSKKLKFLLFFGGVIFFAF